MNLRRSLFVALIAVAITVDATAAAKRRASGKTDLSDTPQAWLWRHAHPIASITYPAAADDLEPLRHIAGHASVVALGDGTHGTREFYLLKIRMIDFLVREMGFDVVAFEAPFPLFNRLNTYVQGGEGNPRALLREVNARLFYRFWDVEEMMVVVEWMRQYNATRGMRPPLQLAGMDIFDSSGGAAAVTDYLRPLDPPAAARAEEHYACTAEFASEPCLARATAIRDELVVRQAEFEPKTGAAAFREVLQNATVVVQSLSFRDRDKHMAANVEWLFARRSASQRIIVWAHQEHVGRTPTPWIVGSRPMGQYLSSTFGDRYVAIGFLTSRGTMLQWVRDGPPIVTSVPYVPGSYETIFQTRPAQALLVPLNGELPASLVTPAPYFSAGTMPPNMPSKDSLPAKFDAVVYIDETTATRPLTH